MNLRPAIDEATPVLRSASGELPARAGGAEFGNHQAETFYHHNAAYRSALTYFGVIGLDNGKWLAKPPGFTVDAPQFDSRRQALRTAIARLIRRARGFDRLAPEAGGWEPGYAGRVIEWALSLKEEAESTTAQPRENNGLDGKTSILDTTSDEAGSPVGDIPGPHASSSQEGLVTPGTSQDEAAGNVAKPETASDRASHAAPASSEPLPQVWTYAGDDAVQLISDPVVRELVEATRKRKQFPANHCFSMTTELEDGRAVSLATCTCGHKLKFGSHDQLRMDAAIEAHWRRHGNGPSVDGRGQPIKPGDPARIPGRRTRKSKKSDGGSDNADAARSNAPIGPGDHPADAGMGGARDPIAGGSAPSPSVEPAPSDALRAEGAGSPETEPDAASLPASMEPASEAGPVLPPDAGSLQDPDDAEFEDLLQISGAVGVRLPGAAAVVDQYVQRGMAFYLRDDRSDWGFSDLGWKRLNQLDKPARRDAGLRKFAQADGRLDDLGSVQDGRKMSTDGQRRDPLQSPGPAEPAAIAAGSPTDDDDIAIDWPSYEAFLDEKIITAPVRGIEVARSDLHPWLKPHCKDLLVWSLRLGCSAIFASFGLHKTAMQLEWCRQLAIRTGSPTLCVLPLGVRHGFISEGLRLGMDVRFIRTEAELDDLYVEEGVRHFITNYESIRDGKLDPNAFGAVSLDEASVLRSFGSKTFQEFLPLFEKVPFKLVATATPSPNRYKELIHYSGFLGVMDTGQALTRFFQRNSEKAGDLTLYPHKEDEFWMWVHSWACFLQKPSDLGYSDEGYELPPLKITWHEVPADHSKAAPERDGQGVMFRDIAHSLSDAAASRRDSLDARVARMSEIIAQDPAAHRLIWHDLEAEREAIEKALPDVVSITGSMDLDLREQRLMDFEEGRTRLFATKPVLSGSGSNFQYHCHKAIYVAMPGYGYKFNDFLQSLFRLQRFGQAHPVEVDIIYSEDERAGRAALEEKWARDAEMRARMSKIIRKHGLDTLPLRDTLARSIGVRRVEIKGERFIAINNDAVAEARTWPDDSVDEIITSIPFSNHYEYSASYNDFGHTDDNAHFWGQMDFLTAELFRMLKPGRLACIHVKDRVLFGAVTGEGVPTISPFHAEAIMHYRAHGFQYMGMITVVTDVVRENNQTYRLGWSECAKDGTKMGVGSPEYVLLMRRPQSDRSRGYADVPVTRAKHEAGDALDLEAAPEGGLSRARWQIDAHAFWRSSGDRLLTPEEFATFGPGDMARLFSKISAERVYDYEAHVRIGERLERAGTLPATFMSIAPGSHDADVWHDVHRMRTLNMEQKRKGAEMHLCPLQFDIVDRLIERFSMPGELVYDPFGGLMTVPYRAILKGRRGAATELNAGYYLDGVQHLRRAEEKALAPGLFDVAEFDAANSPEGE